MTGLLFSGKGKTLIITGAANGIGFSINV
ncbi:hypothetical protein CGLO_01152 [Colletotrichum gloeosporioides Cg-14]|uniref:Uncharacterized protein n=1 Tax=Colletotrichum gloeosporioides (strain Cg-14) TaxID=1237896 RepID=T0L131_COLGC|nr:hypothetical protein CGLO_01152 [Colletotrichum gloeosporioides Cg-14]